MTDQEQEKRGIEARAILNSPAWQAAWDAYRVKCLEIIEAADSGALDTIGQAKRLLTAGTAARGYLERMVKDGAVAAESIRLEEQKRKWWRPAA